VFYRKFAQSQHEPFIAQTIQLLPRQRDKKVFGYFFLKKVAARRAGDS
jgi:hypothetical protein